MEDRTLAMTGMPAAGSPDRTMLTGQAPPMDLQRTAMGAPLRALELEAVAGAQKALTLAGSREHMLLALRASGAAAGRRMPLNICLAIDRSGSMEGEPLEFVKRACSYVVDLLEPSDVLSVVTFEEGVDIVMPARRVLNKALIKEHIARIQAGNTTNVYDGIVAAGAQVASVGAAGYLSRVLVLTDGEPTAGIKDFQSIVNQVGELKQRGVVVTALGFGGEYNEELMAGMARRSGGNYYYIAQPSLIPEVFRREMETLMTISAKNVRVRFTLPRGVQCRYVYGVPSPRLDRRTVEFTLPDVERGAAVTNLTEMEFAAHAAGVYRVARVDVTYDDVVSGRTETLGADVALEFVADRVAVEASKNPVVQRELEVHLASRNLEKTMMGMRTQQLTAMGAIGELQKTRMTLMQAGRVDQANEVTMAIGAIQQGGEAEKTLIGTIHNLDQGKSKA